MPLQLSFPKKTDTTMHLTFLKASVNFFKKEKLLCRIDFLSESCFSHVFQIQEGIYIITAQMQAQGSPRRGPRMQTGVLANIRSFLASRSFLSQITIWGIMDNKEIQEAEVWIIFWGFFKQKQAISGMKSAFVAFVPICSFHKRNHLRHSVLD